MKREQRERKEWIDLNYTCGTWSIQLNPALSTLRVFYNPYQMTRSCYNQLHWCDLTSGSRLAGKSH